jgi:hypothetical protein
MLSLMILLKFVLMGGNIYSIINMSQHKGMISFATVTANQLRIVNLYKNLKHKVLKRNENVYFNNV